MAFPHSRKAILATLAMIVAALGAHAESSSPAAAPTSGSRPRSEVAAQAFRGRTLTIPAQTEATAQLLSGIHTQVSHVGDPIRAQLLKPVYVDGHVALPQGTLLDGRITRIRSAGRLRRPAELSLRFEQITLPDGQDQPIAAVLTALDTPAPPKVRLDSEGQLKGTKPSAWRGLTGCLAGLGALAVVQGNLSGAAALGATLPLGGGTVLGYAFLWPRGSDVHLPPETRFRIRLYNPLTVRVTW
jgi:hypothetical protein